MDYILPEDVMRVILLDVDFFFNTDIKQLFDHFDNFNENTLFGMAYVQQPNYETFFENYRKEHPGTRMGAPPPDGVRGYNGGLIMLHLSNMRRSELYKQILIDNDIKRYGAKYQFRGHLGEQDFFVLLDAEHHELFYVVPCQWNRQLAHRWDTKDDFDVYHDCPKPHHAYHGNGKNIMPKLKDPNLFNSAEIQ